MQIFDGMTATQSLSLQHDGRIPDHLWQAAAAYDREHVKKALRPRSGLRVRSRKLKPETTIQIMAIAMQDAWAKRGVIDERDLEQAGITRADIAEHREAAFQQALAREPRMAEITS